MMNDKCGGGPSFKLCIDTLDNTDQCHSINIRSIVHKITAWTNIRAHSAMAMLRYKWQCNVGLFWANRHKSFSNWLKCKMLPSGISFCSHCKAPSQLSLSVWWWVAVTAQLPGNIKMSGRWCDGDVWMVIVSGDQLEYYDYHTAQHRWGWGDRPALMLTFTCYTWALLFSFFYTLHSWKLMNLSFWRR